MGIHKERAAAPQTQTNPNLFRRLISSVFSRKKAPPETISGGSDSKQAEPEQKPAEPVQTRNERIRKAFKIKQAGDAIVRESEGMRTVTISRRTLDTNQKKLPEALYNRYRDIRFERSIQQLDVEFSEINLIMVGSQKEFYSIKSIESVDRWDERWNYKYLIMQDIESGAGYVAVISRWMGAEKHIGILQGLEKALGKAGKLCPLGGGNIEVSIPTEKMEIFGVSASYGIGNHEAVRDLVREALPFSPSPS